MSPRGSKISVTSAARFFLWRIARSGLDVFLSQEQADDSLSLTFLPEAPVG